MLQERISTVLGVSRLKATGKYAAKNSTSNTKEQADEGVIFCYLLFFSLDYVYVLHLQKLRKCRTAILKTNALNQTQKKWAVSCRRNKQRGE